MTFASTSASPPVAPEQAAISGVFRRLDATYDYLSWHWQPETPADEICIGAILVQHTQWSNVKLAMARLRIAKALSLRALARISEEQLATVVRPAGTPTVKAKRLLALAGLAVESGGLPGLLSQPLNGLRPLLLATPGVGPETADAILLYAAGHPVFEIDAYTVRLFGRLGVGPERNEYHVWQRWFEVGLDRSTGLEHDRVDLYRRYHALIVLHGKATCRPKPRCASCCLVDLCPTGQEAVRRETA